MGIILVIIILAAQSVSTATPAVEPVPLWQSLREGMTVDDAATALRTIEGVKAVEVKSTRKGQALSVRYAGLGVDLVGLPFKVLPEFVGDRLASVRLQGEACLGLAGEKYKNLRGLLADKYGVGRTQREVTEDRQLIALRDTYSSTAKRVLLRLEPGETPQRIYGATGIARTMAAAVNMSVDSAIAECPNDAGTKATIEITYVNNANTAAIEAAAEAEKAARKQREKEKL